MSSPPGPAEQLQVSMFKVWRRSLVAILAAVVCLICLFGTKLNLLIAIVSLAAIYFLTNWICKSLVDLTLADGSTCATYSWSFLLALVPRNLIPTYLHSSLDRQDVRCEDNCGPTAEIDHEVETIVKQISANYVNYWYQLISKDIQFLGALEFGLFQLFTNFSLRCQRLINANLAAQEAVALLADHVRRCKHGGAEDGRDMENFLRKEKRFVANRIEKLLQLCGPSSCKSVISEEVQNKRRRDEQKDALLLMIRDMLSESVAIPIVNFITDPQWIIDNLVYLCNPKSNDLRHEGEDMSNATAKFVDTVDNMEPLVAESTISQTTQTSVSSADKLSDASLMNLIIRGDVGMGSGIANYLTETSSDGFEVIHNPLDAGDLPNEIEFAQSTTRRRSRTSTLLLSQCEEAIEVSSAAEVDEIDLRLFINITIPGTFEAKGPDGSFIVYTIHYDALFEEIVQSGNGVLNNEVQIQLIRKPVVVNRRFSEFVCLQSRLEDNGHLRKHLRGMKKPSRLKLNPQNFLIFPLAMNVKLDKGTINHRRKFLQTYLDQLSNCEPIAESFEFQEFLAYGTDARIAYVKSKTPAVLPQRLNQAFSRGVQGAISIMKTALPVDNPQTGKLDSDTTHVHCDIRQEVESKMKVRVALSDEILDLDRILTELKDDYLNWDVAPVEDTTFVTEHDLTVVSNAMEKLGQRTRGDGCDAEFDPSDEIGDGKSDDFDSEKQNVTYQVLSNKFCKEIPLANSLLDIILLLSTTDMSTSSDKYVLSTVAKIFGGQLVERIVRNMVKAANVKENWVSQLHKLHQSIWPESCNRTQPSPTPQPAGHQPANGWESTQTECVSSSRESAEVALCSFLVDNLSSFNPMIRQLCPKYVQAAATSVMDCLSSQQQNKVFLYQLIDLVLMHINNEE